MTRIVHGWRPTEAEPEVRFEQRETYVTALDEREAGFVDDHLAVDPHEVWLWPVLRALLAEPWVAAFVDVGAHVGEWAVRVGAWTSVDMVLAIEPNTASRTALNRNLALNGQVDRVMVSEVACGADEGFARLWSPHPSSGSSRIGPRALHVGEFEETVPVDRLDRVVPAEIHGACVVKIDVEGHEVAVLEGATGLLLAGAAIVLEDHSALYGTPDAVAFLREAGYVTHLLREEAHTDGSPIRYWLARVSDA